MKTPERLIDGPDDAFERRMLSAGRAERGSEQGLHRTLAAVGIGAATATGASAASASGLAAKLASVGGWSAVKWLGVGVLSGGIALGGSEAVQRFRSDPAGTPVASAWANPGGAARPTERSQSHASGAHTRDTPTEEQTNADPGSLPVTKATAPVALPSPSSAPSPGDRVDREEYAAPDDRLPTAPTPEPPTGPVPPVPVQEHSIPSALPAEIAALDQARSALRAGRSTVALSLLGDYERAYPTGMLRDEALVLRVEALQQAGYRDPAAAIAKDYVARHPHSPHASRLRNLAGLESNF